MKRYVYNGVRDSQKNLGTVVSRQDAEPIPSVVTVPPKAARADEELEDKLGYMPVDYDCANLKFFDDARKYKCKKRMTRSAVETASQISDDECQGGGICPSCRLAVNKDTGRLKWCMGGNDAWRTRIRFMLLIPAVILPVAIIIIAISKSTVIGKLSMRPGNAAEGAADGEAPPTPAGLVNRRSFMFTDRSEVLNRVLHPDVETSFLPEGSLIAPGPLQRRKRDMNKRSAVTLAASAIEPKPRWQSGTPRIHSEDGIKSGLLQELQHDQPAHNMKAYRKLKMSETEFLTGSFSRSLWKSFRGAYRKHTMSPRRTRPRDTGSQGVASAEGAAASAARQSRADLEDCDETEEEDEDGEGSKSESESESESAEEEREGEEEEEEEEDEEDGERSDEAARSLGKDAVHWMARPSHDTLNNGESLPYSVEDDEYLDYGAFWKGAWNEQIIRKAQAKMMSKYMDKTVDPCQDFYQYSCGNWEKYNPIPDDKTGFDTFETLRESLNTVLKQLLEEPVENTAELYEDDAIVKAKHLYRSCMNYKILDQRQETPLLELLDELGGWPILQTNWNPDNFDWLLLVARIRLYNNDVLISEWVGPDIENSDEYVIQFDQTTLGLPTKEYFLQPSNSIYLMAYKNYLITVASLLGASMKTVSTDAEELIQFEIQLANITISPYDRSNIVDLYKRITLDELHTTIPQIDWHRYLSIVLERPVNYSEPVVLFATTYLQDLVKLVSRTPPRIVSNYLFWRFVRHRVNNLDDRFQEAKQTFYYILFGREKPPYRWKNCVAQVNSNMGMAVGAMFVNKYFDEKSKNDTLAMTHEIQRSFHELLSQSGWLDPITKRVASEKVEAMQLRIGYPDNILRANDLNERYKDVSIHPDKYFENTLNILRHLTKIEQNRLGAPVNKTIWNAAPAIVNAYYSRNKNQIMFPAGILQPPFYHRHFPRSLNYGGIGVVIGHEITHGFDNKGRLFDKYGNLHRWWNEDTTNEFNQRASCLIDQYSKYIVKEVEMSIDGINTQGENIADNGGIKQAFRAYEKWLSLNGNANESLPGINSTGRELFFLNFAQVWCGSMRPEAMRNKLKTAVHSPGKYRVIGTLSNSEDFAKVFNCPVGSPMNPEKKCIVW